MQGERLAQATGHRAVQLAGEQKAAYHAAAVVASNCMVALQAAASRVMTTTCGDRDLAWELLWPLVMGTLAGLQEGRFESAITGPVVRGDIGSIGRNLSALANDESARDLYRALGLEALAVARGAGTDDAELERIERVLREG